MERQRKLYEDKSTITIGNDNEATNCRATHGAAIKGGIMKTDLI